MTDFPQMDKVLKETTNCFVATNKDGSIRFGVAGIITVSRKVEVIERALEIAKIEDEDDFEDEICTLFEIGHTATTDLSL